MIILCFTFILFIILNSLINKIKLIKLKMAGDLRTGK